MLFALAVVFGIIGSIISLLYLLVTYFVSGNTSYWDKRNVKSFNTNKLHSVWDRITLKKSFHDADNINYKAIKNAGYKDYAGIVELRTPAFYITDPELIKTVLVRDFDSFMNRRSFDVAKTDRLFSKMLTMASGQEWRNLRHTLSPTFTTGKIRRMYECFNQSSKNLANYIVEKTKESPDLEFRDTFFKYTMDVISSSAFGLESKVFQDNGNPDFVKYGKKFQGNFSGLRAIKFALALFFPKLLSAFNISLTDQESTEFFADVIKKTMAHRKKTGEKRDDFLQLLIETETTGDGEEEAKLDNFEKDAILKSGTSNKILLNEELILAQALLFFVAGFDTVETLLILSAYELALNPLVQEKLHDELKELSAKNKGELNYDLIMGAEYLDKVISETLRKYPPGFSLERKVSKNYILPNTNIELEKDLLVVVPVYGIHHDEDIYPDPEKFDPERFTPEMKAKRNPYHYLPFGAGPRNCIAMRFALAEGKAAIAHLILNFKLEPTHKTQIPMQFSAGSQFKPKNGLWLGVKSRN